MSPSHHDKPTRKRWTLAQLGLGMATFGSATPISKIVTDAMPVFVASVLRVTLGAIALAPFAWRHPRRLPRLTAREWLFIALIALFGMFGFTVLMLYGMRMVSGVVGAIVMSTAPAVTAVASIVFMGEKATWRKLTAVALAVLGVLILHLDMDDGSAGGAGNVDLALGSLLVFCAVCCEAAYTLLGKRISESIDPVVAALLAAALALPLFLPFALWQWDSFSIADVSSRAWFAVVWYGVGTLALGTWLWYAGVKRADGAVAAGFMGVMPVSALVLSYVLLGEPFESAHLAGFLVVFAGVALVSWEHARMERRS